MKDLVPSIYRKRKLSKDTKELYAFSLVYYPLSENLSEIEKFHINCSITDFEQQFVTILGDRVKSESSTSLLDL